MLGFDARRRRRSARSTSTGTAAASRAACAARRSRCSGGSSAWPRRPRSSTPPAAPQAADACARRRSGGWFDPALVDAFADVRGDAAFWESLARRRPRHLGARRPPDRRRRGRGSTGSPTRSPAVVDAKSPWTYRHSDRACLIVMGVAAALGADDVPLRDLRRAALLHDIGKLAVSNRILDKPARLTRGGVRADPRAPADHRADPRAGPGLRAPGRDGRRPPRAARRRRLPARARGRRADDADARARRSPTSTRR